METCFLGADPRNADPLVPPCEMFFDAESLGRAGTTGIQGWRGAGTLVVLISRMHLAFPGMVTIAWSDGEEAVIADVVLEEPCTLQRPVRPRSLRSHQVGRQLLGLVSGV